jgi:tetratricopeptide (TPR) repeat protein
MLKPKRKITKKEIQRDPFIENIFSFKEHINQKKSIYTKVLIGVFAVFILSYLYTNNRSSNFEAAETLISKAMVYVDLGDNDNAMIYLQEVIDEYGNTDAGLNANYYLGQIHFIAGEYEMALPHFERYTKKGKNPLLSLSTYQGLVSIYKSKQDLANAIKYQKISREKANSKEEKAWVSLGLAELMLANGDKNGAIKLISNVLENYEDNFELNQKAEEISGKIYGAKRE